MEQLPFDYSLSKSNARGWDFQRRVGRMDMSDHELVSVSWITRENIAPITLLVREICTWRFRVFPRDLSAGTLNCYVKKEEKREK